MLCFWQVTEHVDSWDTSRCGLPARLAWNASRAAWSLAETSKDIGEDAGKLLGKVKGDDSSGRQVGAPHGPGCIARYIPPSTTWHAGSVSILHLVMQQLYCLVPKFLNYPAQMLRKS